MASTTRTVVTCPVCRQQATVTVTRHDEGGRTTVESCECPSGHQIDDEAVRQIIGTSGN